MAANDKSNILYLFDRPAEPVYVPKGEKKVAFDIPADYLVSPNLTFLSRIDIESLNSFSWTLRDRVHRDTYRAAVNCVLVYTILSS